MLGRKNDTKSGKSRFSLFYGKIRIHPLFLLIGLWHTLTGELAVFISSVVCALLHELAHAAQAAKLGYGAKELTLMPYGATIDMDLEGASVKDECIIALAGPICNLVIAAFFLALWWCFPSAYPYTETAFFATLSLALCNLLPAFPLDGGRVLYCILYSMFNAHLPPAKSKKQAKLVSQIITVLLCAAALSLFVFGAIKGRVNVSLLAFTLFLLVGLFSKRQASYVKLDFADRRAFSRGVPIKHVAVSDACTVKKAISFLSDGQYLVLDVYDKDEKFLGSLTQSQLSDFFQSSHLYAPISEYFADFS